MIFIKKVGVWEIKVHSPSRFAFHPQILPPRLRSQLQYVKCIGRVHWLAHYKLRWFFPVSTLLVSSPYQELDLCVTIVWREPVKARFTMTTKVLVVKQVTFINSRLIVIRTLICQPFNWIRDVKAKTVFYFIFLLINEKARFSPTSGVSKKINNSLYTS